MEFKIPRGESGAKGTIRSLDLRRGDVDLFGVLLQRVLWDKVTDGRGAKKLVDTQGSSLRGVHPTGQEVRKKRLRVVAGKSQI